MNRPLNIAFTDTYTNAEVFWSWLINKRHTLTNQGKPDLLIFGDSNFGTDHLSSKWDGIPKLFFTGENVRAPWGECDFAADFDFETNVNPTFWKKHIRVPLYVLEMLDYTTFFTDDFYYLQVRDINDEEEVLRKTKFCSFVQSNPNVPFRNEFYKVFTKFAGHVDSGGPLFNNIGGPLPRIGGHAAKHNFLATRKFNIAFENGSHFGYVTEKILNAFYANAIPIYWGSPSVVLDFNDKAFINVHDYITGEQLHMQDLLDRVREINENEQKWLDMLHEPVFNSHNRFIELEYIQDWFDDNVLKEIIKDD